LSRMTHERRVNVFIEINEKFRNIRNDHRIRLGRKIGSQCDSSEPLANRVDGEVDAET
jgi:hypothetical protein